MLTIQLLVLLLVLSIIRSLIPVKNCIISMFFSFFLALLFTIQISSVIVTGEIADYRFYENFNIGDALSVAGFFGKEGIIIGLSLLISGLLIHAFASFLRNKIMKKSIAFAILFIGIGVLSISGGIIDNLYKTTSLKLAWDISFDEALTSLQIDNADYVFKDEIRASKGKNIIVLSLESLEKGYMGKKLAHLTPNLRRLSKEHTLFDMKQSPGASWTSGSMYTAITGVPAFFGVNANYVFQSSLENKITSLSDVLKTAGYDLTYFLGKKDYSGIDDMLKTSGFTVKSEIDFETKYKTVDWGIQDKDLFEEFKKELRIKKETDRPFALFLSTISTHFPNGVPDERMDSLLPPQKSRLELMALATDYFVGDLIAFLEKENMLTNTVFYIYPDHLLMGTKSRVIEDFDERSLYLLTNADLGDITYPTKEAITQIDLPKIILEGAEVNTNAKFLTDFIPDKDKNAFIIENTKNLVRLNDAALKTLNCKDGIQIVQDAEKGSFEIKNPEGLVVFSNMLPNKGNCLRVLFDKTFRPLKALDIQLSQIEDVPDTFAYLDIFTTNGRLYASLKEKYSFGITKNGKLEVVFNADDLALLNDIELDEDLQNYIVVNSNSWKAKNPGNFTIKGGKKSLSRGLTLIHFLESDEYEFRTFDTYGNAADAAVLSDILLKLTNTNALYILLASDSAGRHLTSFSDTLKKSGFKMLSNLKDRQAYLAHNLEGGLKEYTSDSTVGKELLFPKNIKTDSLLFLEPKIEFEPKTDRYIAHAGGNIDGIRYTNSKDALDYSYIQGFRMFELDIVKTSDDQFVAAHDWNHWKKETQYNGMVPVTLAQFKNHKIRGKYKTMSMADINQWFKAHPDAILVTDKVDDPVNFAKQFIDKKRLLMELFSITSLKDASEAGIAAIPSEKALGQIKSDVIPFLLEHNISHLALSRKTIDRKKDLLQKCRENNIRIYVYHVNFDAGKDEKYVLDNEIGSVYGMYADTWLPGFMPKEKPVQQR